MPWYRIIIELKKGPQKRGIRHGDLPYPLWERKVQQEAQKAFGADNIRELYITRLAADHPEVRAYLKRKNR